MIVLLTSVMSPGTLVTLFAMVTGDYVFMHFLSIMASCGDRYDVSCVVHLTEYPGSADHRWGGLKRGCSAWQESPPTFKESFS